MKSEHNFVNIIGGGLAGAEAAWYIANKSIKVNLYDMKPLEFSPAHNDSNLAELVCSNSLRSDDLFNAAGLLKQEMRLLNSLIIKAADKNKVPAGSALAVDRSKFSKYITGKISSHPNINIINKKVLDIDLNAPTIIATGPLTEGTLLKNLNKILDSNEFYFFDAAAPIVKFKSIDLDHAFFADRYDKGEGDYLNCPMNQEQYELFYKELLNAETVNLKDFEYNKIFEGCMPIEVMARRGKKAMLFGPLKPVGIYEEGETKIRHHAIVQLRRENAKASLFNMVGFQTNLKFAEQKRIFSLIPALRNAEFTRLGVMHRNSYINAPKVLNKYYQVKKKGYENIFIAGQLSGVEGYIESASSGMYAAINIVNLIKGNNFLEFSPKTAIGALPNYITNSDEKNFQPMNINWGIVDELDELIKDKRKRRYRLSSIALGQLEKTIKQGEKSGKI